MWQTLRNAWKIKELRNKILYTLVMLLVYRFLCMIPTPGVNVAAISETLGNNSLLNFIGAMTGTDFSNYTLMAMGITPYINASIIMQLLCVAIPALEELNKQGEEGRKKIAQYTRFVTVGLGFIQALAITWGLARNGINEQYKVFNLFTVGFCLAAGTALAMWIGERITDKGIGNGVSLLIFAGIIANFAKYAAAYATSLFGGGAIGNVIVQILVILVMFIVITVGIVFVDSSERRIPIQYAKRMVGRKLYGGQSTFIPLKLNASGVLPLIFASAIMQFPSTVLSFFPGKAQTWWTSFANPSGWLYQLIFCLLILGFTFFYSSITFDPIEMSKNIQQNGGMIPGIRQGRPTSDYINKISKRITLFGAIYLAILSLIPSVVFAISKVSLPFAASSMLIAVSVAMESMRELESQMLMRHYKGFLK